MIIGLPESLKAWGSPVFEDTFKSEVGGLENTLLPLQQGLKQSSYVSDSKFNVVILKTSETAETVNIKAGVFYAGVIAGSCCADDPTPMNEQAEYCEIQFEINKFTAELKFQLLQEK